MRTNVLGQIVDLSFRGNPPESGIRRPNEDSRKSDLRTVLTDPVDLDGSSSFDGAFIYIRTG